jgi:hypothetical protein
MQIDSTEKTFEASQQGSKLKQSVDLKWLYKLFIKPRSTLKDILEKERPVWLVPLLILTLFAVLEAVVFSHLSMTEMSNNIRNLDFIKGMSPEEQDFQFRLIGPPIRPLYVYVTPIVYTSARLGAVWFLLSLILNLVLTSAGGKSNLTKTSNIVSWVFLPLGLRYLIQIVSMLVSQTPIMNRGLSYLVVTDEATQQFSYITPFFQSLLGSVDIFFVWTAVLLVLALGIGFGLSNRGKTIALGLLTVLVALVLMALSGFLIIVLRTQTVQSVIYRASWYFQFAW